MKKIFLFLFCLIATISYSHIKFSDYFTSEAMRVDYTRAGNNVSNNIFLEQIKREMYWSGNPVNLLDKFDYGHYKYEVYDKASNKLIFSRGYNTLYDEWQATPESKVVSRSFYETVIFPYPVKPVILMLYQRKADGNFEKQFELTIDPADKFIIKENPLNFPTEKIHYSGDYSKKVDIVFLPDGYTASEMQMFKDDVKKYTQYLLDCSPYKENKDNINVWAVLSPSEESGVDDPGINIWKNNLFSMTYYTQDVERYLMSTNIKTIRDVSALVPYDNICIISNSSKYGGGAIYNYYTSFPNKNNNGAYLIVHEFGHHFCALGDEYYTSEVGVEEYYKLNVEPYEANLTTLVDFDKKWKSMMDSSTPIPTPSTPEYKNTLGVFEGGGYVPKGVYRPKQDCSMKSISYDNFCPVCTKAIIDMIKYYSE